MGGGEELEAGAPALPVEFRTSGWRGMGPLTQSQGFCIIFPEVGLAGDQVKFFVAPERLWGLGVVPMAVFGLLRWVWVGDPAGRAPHPYLRGATREAKAHDLIFGCWTADVWPFGQIGFPIWMQFLFECILFLPPPCLMLGWKLESLLSSPGSWLAVSWGTGVLGLPCWLT